MAGSPRSASSADDRAESATAFVDATPAAAAQLASDTFPEIGAIGADPVPADLEVIEYRNRFTALVDTSGSGSQLLESLSPLRVEGGPVDLDLEHVEGGFAPANSTTEATFPTDLGQGIAIGDDGIEVNVRGGWAAGTAHVMEGESGVLYPDVATDTDLVTGMTVAGVELLAQLRSAASPEELTFPLSIPAGAELTRGSRGGAVIKRGDSTLAAVTPPLAMDADLRPVRSKMSVSGDSLVLKVNHQDKGLHYPIGVDPIIGGDSWDWNSGSNGQQYFNSWQSANTNHQLSAVANQPPYNGLWIKTFPGYYGFNSHGMWHYTVPHGATAAGASPTPNATSAYLTSARFNPWYHYGTIAGQPADWDSSPIVVLCIYEVVTDTCLEDSTPTAASSVFSPGYHNGGGDLTLTNVAVNTQAERVSVDHVGDSQVPSSVYLAAQRWTQVGGFTATMDDQEAPTVSATNTFVSGGTLPTGWTNRTDNVKVAVQGQDGGLGVKQLQLWLGCDAQRLNCTSTPPVWDTPSQTPGGGTSCLGGRSSTCPQGGAAAKREHTFNLGSIPEGVRYGWVQATDPLLKKSSNVQGMFPLRIDRSAPQVQPPSGTLYAERTKLLWSRDYQLSVTATDGSNSSAASQRSGVESIELWVDGAPMDGYDEETGQETPIKASQSALCNAAMKSCPMTMTAQLDVPVVSLTPGNHTIQPVAVDSLGHRSALTQQAFPITVIDDNTEPNISLSVQPQNPDGTYNVVINATDPANGAYASGVERLEVFVDGEPLAGATWEEPCPNGGCTMAKTAVLPSTLPPTAVEVTASAADRAGNAGTEAVGKLGSYEHFGYNENWHRSSPDGGVDSIGLERAVAGGANTIRIFVNWCAIADAPDLAGQPNDWHWYAYGPTLNHTAADTPLGYVKAINTDTNPANNVNVILDLTASPGWANGHAGDPYTGACFGPANIDGPSLPPFPPDSGHLEDWGQFVRGVLDRWGPVHDNPDLPGQQTLGSAAFGVTALQVWNEPNSPTHWGGGTAPWNDEAAHYATLVNEAHAEISSLGLTSDVQLLAGGLSPTGASRTTFLTTALPAMTAGAVDGIAIHLYADHKKQDQGAAARIEQEYQTVRSALMQAGYGSTPRWLTEIGFPSHPVDGKVPDNIDDKDQRRRLLAAYRRFASRNIVHAFIIHRLRDAAQGTGEDHEFGVLNSDLSIKNVYCRLAGLVGAQPVMCP
jgi:hypothetical protein